MCLGTITLSRGEDTFTEQGGRFRNPKAENLLLTADAVEKNKWGEKDGIFAGGRVGGEVAGLIVEFSG